MMQQWVADSRFKNLVFVVLVLAGIGILAYTYLAYTQAKYMGGGMSTISVTGKSEMFIKPDIATFTYSVLAEAPDATTAQTKSADAVNAIMAYLKEQGVDEKDIKTSNYNLYPRYDYVNTSCLQGWCPPGTQRLAGYTVDQSVTVKVRDLEKAGTLIAGVGGKGATNVSGLTFTIDDMEVSKEKVRQEAIEDAKAKAERLADSLGVRLGKLVNYYEEQPYPYNQGYGPETMSSQKAMDGASASVPSVTPGENEVISTVTLIYEIK